MAAFKATTGEIIRASDIQYAADTLKKIRCNKFHVPDDHFDLWADIAEEIMDRQVKIIKVKAHRTEQQMQKDKQHDPVSEQHYMGNNKAYELATSSVNRYLNQCATRYCQEITNKPFSTGTPYTNYTSTNSTKHQERATGKSKQRQTPR